MDFGILSDLQLKVALVYRETQSSILFIIRQILVSKANDGESSVRHFDVTK